MGTPPCHRRIRGHRGSGFRILDWHKDCIHTECYASYVLCPLLVSVRGSPPDFKDRKRPHLARAGPFLLPHSSFLPITYRIGLPIAAVPGVRAPGWPRPAAARQRCQVARAGAGAAILTRCGIRPAERSLRDSGPLRGSRRSPGLESSHEKDDDVEAQAQGSLHRRRVVHGCSRGGAHHPGDRDRGQQRPRRVTPPEPLAALRPWLTAPSITTGTTATGATAASR